MRKRDNMHHQRTSRRKGRIAAGIAAVTLGGGMLILPIMTASAAAPPTAYGADAVGKALYQVYNAVAQVDPALPSSRAAAQVDPSASPPVLLTTYGYANDQGTLLGAVLFAPPGAPTCGPDPFSSLCTPPAPAVSPANFPGLAEAFYPVPDQEHVRKCAANTDSTNAQGNSTCESANTGTWYASADASPKDPLGPSARGFASEAGPNLPKSPFAVKQLSSESNVTPDQDGNLTVLQENKGQDFTIQGTQLAASFEASSHLKATADAVTGDAVCRVDFTLAGTPIPFEQVQPVLDAVSSGLTASPWRFQVTPPTPPVVDQDSLGGTASCTGATISATDTATGSSITYTLGTTVSRAARLGQTLAAASDQAAAPAASSGGDGSSFSSSSDGSSFSSAPATSTGSSTAPVESAAPAPTQTQEAAPAAAPRAPTFNGPKLITKKINAVPVGIVTALGTIGVLLGSWLLLSSVAGLGRRGISLAGWQTRP